MLVAAQFSDDFKERVRAATDIVALISESVALQSKGRDYVGLCPFHEDHNPSFNVNAERQSWRCWVCNDGGDCFSYVMKLERLSFPETLQQLAERAGIPLPRQMAGELQKNSQRSSLYDVLAWAEREFHDCLMRNAAGERARNYLSNRKITTDSMERFRLGYHPDNWQWLLRKARDFDIGLLEASRLVSLSQDRGNHHDFVGLVDRVQFPIHDARGRAVAFGGRMLPDSQKTDAAKYINSPESDVFNKSRMLYGLHHARQAISKSQVAIVTEGYTDCIACHQAGITNAVATLGTALTELHVAELKRFARTVILVYDGDAAGQRSTERSLPKFLAQEVDLRILTLPEDLDPAEYIERYGSDALQRLMEGSVEAWDHKLQLSVARYGLDSIDSRHRVLSEMLDVVAQVPVRTSAGLSDSWQLRESVILGTLAQRLSLSEELIRRRLGDIRQQRAQKTTTLRQEESGSRKAGTVSATSRDVSRRSQVAAKGAIRKLNPRVQVERELLEVIFAVPQLLGTVAGQISAADVSDGQLRTLFEVCLELSTRGQLPTYQRVTSSLEDVELKRLAAELEDHSRRSGVTESLLPHVLQFFQLQRSKQSSAAGNAASGTPGVARPQQAATAVTTATPDGSTNVTVASNGDVVLSQDAIARLQAAAAAAAIRHRRPTSPPQP